MKRAWWRSARWVGGVAFALAGAVFVGSCAHKGNLSGGKIPLRDFFKNPEATNYQISPDGGKIAYLKAFQSRMNIHMQIVGEANSEKRLTEQLDRDISSFFWKENGHIVFMRDFDGDENFHIFVLDIQKQTSRDLTPFAGVRARLVDSLDETDPQYVLVELNKDNPQIFDVYRLNIATGHLVMVEKNPGKYTSWKTDHDGKLRLAVASDGVNTELFYREREGQKFKSILRTDFKDSLDPLFFAFDNKRFYAASNLGRDKSAIVEFDPVKKKEVKLIFQHPEVDAESLLYSKKRKILTGVSVYTSKEQSTFFDKLTEQIYGDLKQQLPGVEVRLSSSDRAETKYIVRTFSDRTLGAFYLYDSVAKKLDFLGEVSPWLKTEQMAEMKPIQFTSRDGLVIHGYLTQPLRKSGEETKPWPVVVNPHGGPWARDHWGYNPTVQFLANRGYAVLQLNFRGSTGYGKKFWQASFKQWGKTMQDDISDGVQWLVKEGVADAKRVGIYGGSYGGYATLAGLAFTPDLYACGIDYVGVSNIFTLLETIPPYWEPYRAMLYEMIGHPEKDKELLQAASPLYHVQRIKAPLFVAQGAKDPRVKKQESDQIVAALKQRNVDVPYLVKDNEGHGFRNEENRFEFFTEMEKFLAKHL